MPNMNTVAVTSTLDKEVDKLLVCKTSLVIMVLNLSRAHKQVLFLFQLFPLNF